MNGKDGGGQSFSNRRKSGHAVELERLKFRIGRAVAEIFERRQGDAFLGDHVPESVDVVKSTY